jgi:Right handed beta helix region/Bacterial TSP3 repeat
LADLDAGGRTALPLVSGMSREVAAPTEENTPMSKWLVLPIVVLAYLAGTVSAAAPRDRDDDGLPDRWERKHNLSTSKPSAKRDPDRDRLRNRRELRLRTHPRRADTDRDGLRDGAEVRRFHTNPRKRDTDGDGFRDRCELRSGTNPRERRSRPARRCAKSPQTPPSNPTPTPPGGSPRPTGPWPDASNTGVPPGTTLTPTGGITVTQPGTVIHGVDAPWIEVEAANVTIRSSRIHSDAFSLIYNRTSSPGLVVEDSELIGAGGTGISSSNFTARRVEITGVENGCSIGGRGNVAIVDSYIHDLDTSGGAHTDGCQIGEGAHDILFHHNHISPQDSGPPASTSAIIMYTGAGAQNTRVRIESNLLDGSHASVALYAPRHPASDIYINNNRFRRGVFGYADSVRVPTHVTEFNGNVDDLTGRLIGR